MINDVTIPQGYSRMYYVSFNEDLTTGELMDNGDMVNFVISPSHVRGADEATLPEGSPEYRFEVKVNQFVERDRERNTEGYVEPLIVDNGKELLMFNRFSFSVNQDKTIYLSGEGILFTK